MRKKGELPNRIIWVAAVGQYVAILYYASSQGLWYLFKFPQATNPIDLSGTTHMCARARALL